MSVLSDRDIRAELDAGRVVIRPYDAADLQPSSVDLHLDRSFRVFRNNRYPYIDVRELQPDLTELLTIADDEPFILHPGEFVLGQTLEWVELPDDLVARLEGKSSLGRLGLLIHSTAGYVDPGWKGTLTLELSNVANLPITLYQGMKIGQISFFRMSSPVERPYGSSELGSLRADPQVACLHVPGWEILQGEHHLKERSVGQAALHLELVNQALEGQILMGEGLESPLVGILEQLDEAELRLDLGPHHQGVDEEPDQLLRLRVMTTRHRRADAQIPLPGVAEEQGLESRHQGHEGRASLAPGEP